MRVESQGEPGRNKNPVHIYRVLFAVFGKMFKHSCSLFINRIQVFPFHYCHRKGDPIRHGLPSVRCTAEALEWMRLIDQLPSFLIWFSTLIRCSLVQLHVNERKCKPSTYREILLPCNEECTPFFVTVRRQRHTALQPARELTLRSWRLIPGFCRFFRTLFSALQMLPWFTDILDCLIPSAAVFDSRE